MHSNLIKLKLKRIDLLAVLGTFIFFSMTMDAGGQGGLRVFGFLLMFVEFIFSVMFRKSYSLSKKVLVSYFLIASLLWISILIALNNGVELNHAVTYTAGMFFFIIFYYLVKNDYLKVEYYLNAEILFAWLLVIFFFGSILNITPVVIIKQFCIDRFSGLYGKKPFLTQVFKVTYFEGTLTIIPAAIIFLYRRKYFNYFICLLSLALSLSRFGVFVCLLFLLLRYMNLHTKKILPLLVLFVALLLLYYAMHMSSINLNRLFEGDGMRIRLGHLQGWNELFSEHPFYLLIGQGPGAEYYTYGFHRMTDSIEVSQLDLIRRFGLIFTIIYHLVFFLPVSTLIHSNKVVYKSVGVALIAHYIVSFSNPVLFSLPTIALFAIAVKMCEDIYTNNYIYLMENRNIVN